MRRSAKKQPPDSRLIASHENLTFSCAQLTRSCLVNLSRYLVPMRGREKYCVRTYVRTISPPPIRLYIVTHYTLRDDKSSGGGGGGCEGGCMELLQVDRVLTRHAAADI